MFKTSKVGLFFVFTFLLSFPNWGCGFGGGGSSSDPTPANANLVVPDPEGPSGGELEDPDDNVVTVAAMAPPFDYGPTFKQQDGPSGFTFTPSTANYTINWAQFGNFNPIPGHWAVYNGAFPGEENASSIAALSHGFTHCQSGPNLAARDSVPQSKRAVLWTGVAGATGQPWNTIESPWNNSVSAFESKWSSYFKAYANLYTDTYGQDVPKFDLMISDMEALRDGNASILELKGDPQVPASISALSDSAFIEKYKKDMGAIHNSAHVFAKAKGFLGKLGSYGVTPIVRTWWGIDDYTWSQWTTDKSRLFFLLMDYLGGANWLENYGPFYDSNDVMASSGYVFYDYSDYDYNLNQPTNQSQWNQAGDYLAYVLFQAEVNQKWSPEKDQIMFLWLRYHDGNPNVGWCGKPIRNHMAHALGIFPFLCGMKGIWLWDHYDSTALAQTYNFSAYESLVYGMYRLSLHSSLFVGNTEPYAPYDPCTLMTTNKTVVRGIVNLDQEKLLVAVHNPYANLNQDTVQPIYYNSVFLGNVTVHGLDTAIEELDINPVITCIGDINNDGTVNGGDMILLMVNMGLSGPNLQGDLNNDGTVNQTDLNMLNANWGTCPP